jgi:SCY1-like protein 2
LDSSFQVDNLQKSQFFKSLPQIIDKLPKRVCLQRIIPCLEQEFINPEMIPFILPSLIFMADDSTNDEYIKHILPRLKIVFKIQKPVQVIFLRLKYTIHRQSTILWDKTIFCPMNGCFMLLNLKINFY